MMWQMNSRQLKNVLGGSAGGLPSTMMEHEVRVLTMRKGWTMTMLQTADVAGAFTPVTRVNVDRPGATPRDVARLTDSDRLVPTILEALGPVASYLWYDEENYRKALRWCTGLHAADDASRQAAGSNPELVQRFFVSAIRDIWHYDRALRAHKTSETPRAPIRRSDIPKEIFHASVSYRLTAKPFEWTQSTPHAAATAVATLLNNTFPDELWIADYVEKRQTYDPIIYARFGNWEVEIARWE